MNFLSKSVHENIFYLRISVLLINFINILVLDLKKYKNCQMANTKTLFQKYTQFLPAFTPPPSPPPPHHHHNCPSSLNLLQCFIF